LFHDRKFTLTRRMCFQTSSTILVRNPSVWETYIVSLICRSSLQFS